MVRRKDKRAFSSREERGKERRAKSVEGWEDRDEEKAHNSQNQKLNQSGVVTLSILCICGCRSVYEDRTADQELKLFKKGACEEEEAI